MDLQDEPSDHALHPSSEEDQRLQMNAKIGTALMLVNSHRALLLLYVCKNGFAPAAMKSWSHLVILKTVNCDDFPYHLLFWEIEPIFD